MDANELLETDAFRDSWYELMLWKPLHVLLAVRSLPLNRVVRLTW